MSGPTVADLGERALIDRIRLLLPAPPSWVAVGIGDDAAVIEPARNRLDVVTADSMVEGVHFDRAVVPASAIGYKALAVNLSDLAAMGAEPRAAVLSLGLRPDLAVADVDAFVGGLNDAAAEHPVAIVGGNIARSPGPMFVDITAIGTVHPRRVLRRSGARPGDLVFVSGEIGSASAGLQALTAGAPAIGAGEAGDDATPVAACVARFLRPSPRVRLGLLLGRNRVASACVDLSDGLGDGLRQLAEASDVGLSIDADAVPIASGAREWFGARGFDPVDAAFSGGEDYELLFTVPRRRRRAFEAVLRLARGVRCTRIGEVTPGPGINLRRASGPVPLPHGFAHFR